MVLAIARRPKITRAASSDGESFKALMIHSRLGATNSSARMSAKMVSIFDDTADSHCRGWGRRASRALLE